MQISFPGIEILAQEKQMIRKKSCENINFSKFCKIFCNSNPLKVLKTKEMKCLSPVKNEGNEMPVTS